MNARKLRLMEYDAWLETQRTYYRDNIQIVDNCNYEVQLIKSMKKNFNQSFFDDFTSDEESNVNCYYDYTMDELTMKECNDCIDKDYPNCDILNELERVAIDLDQLEDTIEVIVELNDDGYEVITDLEEIYSNRIAYDKKLVDSYNSGELTW